MSLAEEHLNLAEANADQLTAIYAALERFWTVVASALPEPPNQAWRLALATAVIEIATNVMRHAYPGQQTNRGLSLRLQVYPDQIVATLQDQGIPVPAASLTAALPEANPLDLAEGGYGLELARACVDTLDYSRTSEGTNRWRLVKRLA